MSVRVLRFQPSDFLPDGAPCFQSFQRPEAISRAFPLLGRWTELLSDKKFLIWIFLRGSNSRRTALKENWNLATERLCCGLKSLLCPLLQRLQL